MGLQAIKKAVSQKAGEASQKRTVMKALSRLGHTRAPKVRKVRMDDGTVARVYVWRQTPLGDLALVTGPQYEPDLYELQPGQDVVLEAESSGARANPAGRPPRFQVGDRVVWPDRTRMYGGGKHLATIVHIRKRKVDGSYAYTLQVDDHGEVLTSGDSLKRPNPGMAVPGKARGNPDEMPGWTAESVRRVVDTWGYGFTHGKVYFRMLPSRGRSVRLKFTGYEDFVGTPQEVADVLNERLALKENPPKEVHMEHFAGLVQRFEEAIAEGDAEEAYHLLGRLEQEEQNIAYFGESKIHTKILARAHEALQELREGGGGEVVPFQVLEGEGPRPEWAQGYVEGMEDARETSSSQETADRLAAGADLDMWVRGLGMLYAGIKSGQLDEAEALELVGELRAAAYELLETPLGEVEKAKLQAGIEALDRLTDRGLAAEEAIQLATGPTSATVGQLSTVKRMLDEAGIIPHKVYHVPRQTDPSDAVVSERWFRIIPISEESAEYQQMDRDGEKTSRNMYASDLYFLREWRRELVGDSWPILEESRKLSDLAAEGSGERYPGQGPENKALKAVLQAAFPDVKWKVTGDRGTAYGWTDVKGKAPDLETAREAADFAQSIGLTMGRPYNTTFDGLGERRHFRIPAEYASVAIAAAASAPSRRQETSQPEKLSADELQPGDLVIRFGMYTGKQIVDVVMVEAIGTDRQGLTEAQITQPLLYSDTFRRKRYLQTTGAGDEFLGEKVGVDAPDFTPKKLQARGAELLAKYAPQLVQRSSGRVFVTGHGWLLSRDEGYRRAYYPAGVVEAAGAAQQNPQRPAVRRTR